MQSICGPRARARRPTPPQKPQPTPLPACTISIVYDGANPAVAFGSSGAPVMLSNTQICTSAVPECSGGWVALGGQNSTGCFFSTTVWVCDWPSQASAFGPESDFQLVL